jgi:hypothetical protein
MHPSRLRRVIATAMLCLFTLVSVGLFPRGDASATVGTRHGRAVLDGPASRTGAATFQLVKMSKKERKAKRMERKKARKAKREKKRQQRQQRMKKQQGKN